MGKSYISIAQSIIIFPEQFTAEECRHWYEKLASDNRVNPVTRNSLLQEVRKVIKDKERR